MGSIAKPRAYGENKENWEAYQYCPEINDIYVYICNIVFNVSRADEGTHLMFLVADKVSPT